LITLGALNHWHFIDLDIVDFKMPEGLVCLCRPDEGEDVICTAEEDGFYSEHRGYGYRDMSAFIVLGVTEEYREAGEALSMEVVTL